MLIGLMPGVKRPMLNVSLTPMDNNNYNNLNKDMSEEIVMKVQTRKDKRQTNFASLVLFQIPLDDISKNYLISEQSNCPVLKDIRSKLNNGSTVTGKKRSVKYEKKEDFQSLH